MKEKREGKTMKRLNNIASFILFTLLIGALVLVFASKASNGEPSLLGYQLKVVLSGSMEPDIQTGSIIAVKLGGDMSRFNKGDVITFRDEEKRLITHRVTEVIQSGDSLSYQTKGDNNDGPDLSPVLPKNVTAEYTGFTVPYVGYALSFMQSKNGALVIIGAGFLLLLYSLFTVKKALSGFEITRKGDEEGKTTSS
ncbi:signal peptidase I SipW [Sporosarcina sp. NPDC096371]|uniref:signal peptidase I SipW n=1 Tax=Sporosarcina sp. NPDC096371 TaxID=3364530 RepID=UPI003814AD43